jgi:ABC-type multidrug transport system permease subunit
MFAIPLFGVAGLRKSLPWWLKWISLIGFCSTLFSLMISAYPFVDVVNARVYAAKILGTTACSNLVGAFFYRIRSKTAVGNAARHSR